MNELYIGLMSGTSVDGIDAALVNLSQERPVLVDSYYHAYSPTLRKEILALCKVGENEINRYGALDVKLGELFAETVNELLKKQQLLPKQIRAIGSHGHTIRHDPIKHFSLQIADPNIICAHTGILTVGDFRRKDMALGGQGAPLVPAFHQAVFQTSEKNRVIVNIGGIANITLLFKNGLTQGFDTGPGNTLLDAWAEKHLGCQRDEKGQWAATGHIHFPLLNTLLTDPFFKLAGPKSTGKEYFNLQWLKNHLIDSISPEDAQATLVELTAKSILSAIPFEESEIFICGGGWHNDFFFK